MDINRIRLLAFFAHAMNDETVPLVESVQFVRNALTESDPWTRGFAAITFVHKCSSATQSQWDKLKTVLESECPRDSYLLKIGTLGHLFSNYSSPNRNSDRAAIIRWLLKTDPADRCLETPYGNDVDDTWYEVIKPEWLAIVKQHREDVRVLSNAARFFFRRDQEISEQLYSKCAALEPGEEFWQERISKLREFHAPRDLSQGTF